MSIANFGHFTNIPSGNFGRLHNPAAARYFFLDKASVSDYLKIINSAYLRMPEPAGAFRSGLGPGKMPAVESPGRGAAPWRCRKQGDL